MDWLMTLAAFTLLLGAFFVFIAALGLLRLPDMLMRMHATTKAGTLGAGLILVAVALFFAEFSVTTRVLATIVFILLTAPVAAHLIGRAGYYIGIKLWKGTYTDELSKDSDHISTPVDPKP